MSKVICSNAIDGAIAWVAQAEAKLNEAIEQKDEDHSVAFPNTAYFLPIIYSFTGKKVETFADMRAVLAQAKELLPGRPADQTWLPYLGNTLDAGIAALFACEIIEACKYAIGPEPVWGIWLGAANDVIMRERGIEFVDGTAPGFAAVTGAAPTNEIAVKIARELQEKNLYVFMGGSHNGTQFAEQLHEAGVQLGWETRLVPFGKDVSALVYALGFANRAALSFGGVKPGGFTANLRYNKERIFAFVLALGEVTPDKYAVAAGAINYGFPVIADTDIPEILPTGVCTYEHVVSRVPHDSMVERALEVRGCKVKIAKVPIPVPYGPAFEGERIRKADVQIEFGGNKSTAFEFVTSVELDAINDGEIETIGPEIDQVEQGSSLPLAIWVEVAGRKMQSDFEPILERQIHHLVNGAEGIWHMGQRDIVWTRVSKDGFAKGLRLKHYGEILHAKFLNDYPAIVDKVKVTLVTDADEVERRVAAARSIYRERNKRLESMTDESVDTFYSCLLCQSFAPNHVCIITPERLGLCGAYNWLDGKAAYEIDETGPNQPVKKGECLDPLRGVWQGVNEYVYPNSHKAIESFSAYSIMNQPMTSCGCFEVICAYVPELNGVMAVNREFQGDTPVGMTFSTLAGSVGGGQQTPGFIGVGKVYLTSKKFLYAEGGHKRLVWMPRELKKMLEQDIKQRAQEQGIPDLLEKIADEAVGINTQDVRAHLERVKHPAIAMEDMAQFAESTAPTASPPQKTQANATPAENDSSPTKAQPVAAAQLNQANMDELKKQIAAEVTDSIRAGVTQDIVKDIINTLSRKFLGGSLTSQDGNGHKQEASVSCKADPRASAGPKAAERIAHITAIEVPRESCEVPIASVSLGAHATKKVIGGETCMPFHLWEGDMPNKPLVALEVFDTVAEKYPQVLRAVYGDIINNPAAHARECVERHGADLISVRLEGTHPEKGNRHADAAVDVVKSVLDAVDVPLIITGHNHFDSNNEVLKAVAQACAGKNLLLNWVEQDNYKTIAGAALAYGHSLVAQSPIDVNIAKQLNILLTNMDIPRERIVIDPMTGATGYGIEYTYSVMERIRLTAINGDALLAFPMIVSPGQECAKIKEFKATQDEYPAWGELASRAAMWELSTATSLLYAGADILIMYHPEAATKMKNVIDRQLEKSTS
ncbi:MAG: CO dehydrogenase/CO-methylating acetyl-CoA synthase complex subunit beta [Chitinivibrionales bacterium]|nr:CO dehydrogenase/CO-methylating acetyl-CoA synthase complex subunit beta [Chitinivibrionales bacterium]